MEPKDPFLATHCVIPPGSRTPKSLGAGLLGRHVVPPDWVEASTKLNRFADEESFGSLAGQRPFRCKTFFVSAEFKEQWAQHSMMHEAVRELIVTYGQGALWDEMEKRPDVVHFTLIASDSPSSSQLSQSSPSYVGPKEQGIRISWEEFLDRVPGDYTAYLEAKRKASKHRGRPRRGSLGSDDGSTTTSTAPLGRSPVSPATPSTAPRSRSHASSASGSNHSGSTLIRKSRRRVGNNKGSSLDDPSPPSSSRPRRKATSAKASTGKGKKRRSPRHKLIDLSDDKAKGGECEPEARRLHFDKENTIRNVTATCAAKNAGTGTERRAGRKINGKKRMRLTRSRNKS